MEKSTYIGIGLFLFVIIAGFFFINRSDMPSASRAVKGEAQRIVLSEKNLNYYPNEIKVKVGQPVSISLDTTVTGCLRSFTIRELDVSKYTKTPQDTIEFAPTRKGRFRFACSMGMGYGTIIVE